jgi:transcriptional regulator with XRE-family HTH domain
MAGSEVGEKSSMLQTDDEISEEESVSLRTGARVRSLRELRGLSTRKLAAAAGISQPFLSQLERGIGSPSLLTLHRLATALGVTPGDLIPSDRDGAVSVIRAGEGTFVPANDRPTAAVARMLIPGERQSLGLMQYRVEPSQNVPEWFTASSDNALYILSGRLRVDLRDEGSWELGPDDVLFRTDRSDSRWTVIGDEPVSLLMISSRSNDVES